MRKYLTSALLLLFLAIFCTGGPAGTDEQQKEIMPLSVGNWWKYQIRLYSDDKVVKYDTVVISVEEELYLDNQKWYELKSIQNRETNIVNFCNKDDGLWSRKSVLKKETGKTFLAFRYPTKTGDCWIGDKKDTVRTKNLSVIIRIALGQFDCIEYEFEEGVFLVCPGTGLIKVMVDLSSSSKVEVELIDYQID